MAQHAVDYAQIREPDLHRQRRVEWLTGFDAAELARGWAVDEVLRG